MNKTFRPKRYLLPLLLLLGSFFVSAQVTIKGYNKGWLQINSNNGGIIRDVVAIHLEANGVNNLNFKNWSVVGRITTPINNGENPEFPVDKVKLYFNNIQFTQYFSTENLTVPQIGIIQSDVQMSFSQVNLIKNSSYPLNVPNGKFGSMTLGYDVKIEGGNYLNSHKSWKNYLLNFEITLLNEYGKVMNTSIFPLDMMISPNGNFDPIPALSIELNSDARNASLSFYNMKDYVGGVTAEYPNALIVKSDTAYEIQVAASNDKLQAVSGDLAVSAINVKLKDADTNALSNSVSLSATPQKLTSGTKINNQKKYSIIYSTKPSDNTIMNSKPGTYTTTLLYTISPL